MIEEHVKAIATLKGNVSNPEQCQKLEENKTISGKGDVPLERTIGGNSRQSELASTGRSNIGLDEESFLSSTEVQGHDIGLHEIEQANPEEIGRFISESSVPSFKRPV